MRHRSTLDKIIIDHIYVLNVFFKMLGLNIVDSYQRWLYKQTHFFKSPRLAE